MKGAFLIYWTICFLVHPLLAQIILTEIMFDPDTLEFHNEYVELYNAGQQPQDLSGWRVGDSLELDALTDAGEGLLLDPGQYAVILDASYFGHSTVYDTLIPDSALVLTIDDGSFGHSGWSNTHSEPVILVNDAGDTVQLYRYSTGNLPGYSDEKRLLTPDNSSVNWGDSRRFRGTPGFTNSITPPARDLAVDTLLVLPSFPQETNPFQLVAIVKNQGYEVVDRFQISFFRDDNGNARLDTGELLDSLTFQGSLALDDTARMQLEISGIAGGQYMFGCQVELPGDEHPENNVRIIPVRVESVQNDLILNEMMYRPMAGWGEWVEIYHRGTLTINLKGFCFADARDTVEITGTDFWCQPGMFYILTGDSATILQYHLNPEITIVVPGFPALNNDTDDLKLISPSGRQMDRVHYFDEWMRREVDPGTSLERIQPERPSGIADNWAACVAPSGSTPGAQNSVFIPLSGTTRAFQVAPNPFSPDGDGFEDFTLIQYHLPVSLGYLTVRIFDLRGRLVRELAQKMPVGQQGSLVWDGKGDNGENLPIGMYVIFAQIFDEMHQFRQELRETVVIARR